MTIQLEITDEQRAVLESLAHSRGLTPQQIFSQALDRLLDEDENADWRLALLSLEGIWKDRDDLPDFQAVRQEFDRNVWER